jgi:hypothetical protein
MFARGSLTSRNAGKSNSSCLPSDAHARFAADTLEVVAESDVDLGED